MNDVQGIVSSCKRPFVEFVVEDELQNSPSLLPHGNNLMAIPEPLAITPINL